MPSREKKEKYFETLRSHLTNYDQMFIVHADHVGSKLMADIRYKIRGSGDVLMGKNTMMRKCIAMHVDANSVEGEKKDMWDAVLSTVQPDGTVGVLRGNVGFIFVKAGMLEAVRTIIVDNTVPAPARAGTEAQIDVFIPPGPTGCDPSQTSYFQALNVPTKISRGQIEITNQVHAVKKGDRVSPGAADLLAKLNITPFTFGLVPKFVFDKGAIYDPAVLDLTNAVVQGKFSQSARNVAAMSIACNYPTMASLPHSFALGVKMCAALIGGAESTYAFEKGKHALAFLADPEAALAAAAAAAASSGSAGGAEEKKEEEEEEEEEAAEVGGLFGDGDGDEAW